MLKWVSSGAFRKNSVRAVILWTPGGRKHQLLCKSDPTCFRGFQYLFNNVSLSRRSTVAMWWPDQEQPEKKEDFHWLKIFFWLIKMRIQCHVKPFLPSLDAGSIIQARKSQKVDSVHLDIDISCIQVIILLLLLILIINSTVWWKWWKCYVQMNQINFSGSWYRYTKTNCSYKQAAFKQTPFEKLGKNNFFTTI